MVYTRHSFLAGSDLKLFCDPPKDSRGIGRPGRGDGHVAQVLMSAPMSQGTTDPVTASESSLKRNMTNEITCEAGGIDRGRAAAATASMNPLLPEDEFSPS